MPKQGGGGGGGGVPRQGEGEGGEACPGGGGGGGGGGGQACPGRGEEDRCVCAYVCRSCIDYLCQCAPPTPMEGMWRKLLHNSR